MTNASISSKMCHRRVTCIKALHLSGKNLRTTNAMSVYPIWTSIPRCLKRMYTKYTIIDSISSFLITKSS